MTSETLPMGTPDAVVIGAGQNGLVAANVLADAGWSVVVLEAQATAGGAVKTEELVEPGFKNDLYSAFYPLGYASPVLKELDLEQHGLRWLNSPLVLANPLADGRCAVLSRDIDETAASLDAFAPGDGDAWRRLFGLWKLVGEEVLQALLRPFPPVSAGLRLAAKLGPSDLLRFARFGLLPVRRLAQEEFNGDGGGLLLAGNALHSDVPPEGATSGFLGWLLCMSGQDVGFPAPEGGAAGITNALVRRLEQRGGRVVCGVRVDEVLVRGGRAVGVRTQDGTTVDARRAVLADLAAPTLYLHLLPPSAVPPRVMNDIHRFQWDNATVKLDWTLDGPIPWAAEPAARAGTVHLAQGMDHLTDTAGQLAQQRVPAKPFLLLGQMTTTDPTRSPAGTETVWAYTHVPQHVLGDAGPDGLTGSWDERETEVIANRIEDQVEQLAPGFRSRVRGRHVMSPNWLQAHDENLFHGAVSGGTAQLHQQLVFRPTPGLAGARTTVRGVYLASSSAHPGGGVHGACGANAAHAALQDAGLLGAVLRAGAGAGRAVDAVARRAVPR